MITVNFYSFSKRKNSTKQPTGNGTQVSCCLKDGCNENQPTFIINATSFNYNYAKWDNRYYFVTSVEHTRNNLYTVSCALDVLATFKADIVGASAFVMYSATETANVPDTRLPQVTTPTISANAVNFRDDLNVNGNYIISTVGTNGSVTASKIARGDLTDLLNSIDDWGNTIWEEFPPVTTDGFLGICEAIGNLCDYIRKMCVKIGSVGNATDCIRNLIWLPFTITADGGDADLYLGDYDTGISVGRINNPIVVKEVSVDIPWQFSDWRNGSKCTQVYLYIPFVGMVSYSAENLVGITSLTVRSSLCKTTGDITIEVSAGNQVLGTYGANCAVQQAVGSSNISPTQALNTLIQGAGMVADVATGNVGGFGALAGMLQNITPNVSCVGGIGNSASAGMHLLLKCFTVCHNTIQAPSAVASIMGTPTFKVEAIPNTGYVQTMNASIPLSAHSDEIDAVNNFLNGGIYVE